MPFIMLLLPVGPLLQGLCTRIFIVRASVMVIISLEKLLGFHLNNEISQF